MKKKGNKMVPNCVPAGMKKGGLKEWFRQDWVDIGAKKKGGGFKKCGRKSASGSKRKYPKCVPAAKAASMTESQRRSAVARKRARAQGVGGKPTNVKTIVKRSNGGMSDGPPIRTSKFGVGLFTYKKNPKPLKYGENIIKAVEDNKVEFDPNLTYSKLYKDNIQVDLGISKKGKGIFKIRKTFGGKK
tara:strand:+ start:103 stop:663 length:561 start_codon:yes stop_codon:yes gene_type:complete